MDATNVLAKLPESIGMCLSGGGFRAAAFHLGAMAYLNRVGLLSRVHMLSTVSGGTITGAKYAISLTKRESFQTFFKHYYRELEEQHDPNFEPLIKTGLKHLGSGIPTNTPSGRRNLITSMAQTYCESLFYDKEHKRSYRFKDILETDTALTEITFNATDFRTGIAFRFQKSGSGLIGNLYSHLSRESAGKLRLGDIVAASSCFPGGFEPMEFPVDFGWPDNQLPEDVRQEFEGKSIGLMDGGVYDNQGIDSLLLADKRPISHQPANSQRLDLFIMSDTDRTSENLFPFPPPVRDASNFWLQTLLKRNPSLRVINAAFRGLQLLCIATVVMISFQALTTEIGWTAQGILWGTLVYGVPLLLALFTALILWGIRNQLRWAILPQIPVVGFAGWNDLKRLRLDQLIDMLNLRGRSLLALTSNVFMKRIRQLGYRIIYSDKQYARKVVANYVYHLKSPDWFFEKSPDLEKLSPSLRQLLAQIPSVHTSPQLVKVIERAEAMQTTLWFNEASELPAIVAAGQATMCFNLMKYIVRNYPFDVATQTFPDEVQVLWEQLTADWEHFVKEPYKLLHEELGRRM